MAIAQHRVAQKCAGCGGPQVQDRARARAAKALLEEPFRELRALLPQRLCHQQGGDRCALELLTPLDATAPASIHSMHSVTNLALLSSGDNSALGNAVFEVKRRRILELDRKGVYIPICTRQVFLKYYTDAGAQQVYFWGAQDRESYLQAMISADRGVLFQYLRPEDRQS